MERKITNIKERILYYTDLKDFKKEKFFEDLGVSYGNFKGKAKNQALGSDVIERIVTKYSDINIEWLITGKGNPLKEVLKKDIDQNILGHNNTMIGNNLNSDNSLTIKVLINQIEDCKKIITEKDNQINKLLNIMGNEKKQTSYKR